MIRTLYLAFPVLISLLSGKNIEQQLFIEANNYMIINKYSEAISSYEKLISLGNKNSEIFYNLGNAYYRNNDLGLSIWAYLSSLKLKPRSDDALHNLSITMSQTNNHIDLPKNNFIFSYYKKIKSNYTFDESFFVGSLIFLTFSILSLLIRTRFLESQYILLLNKSTLILFLSVVLMNMDKYYFIKIKKGVAISKFTDAYSGPGYVQNKVIFRLNEGALVNINNTKGDWVEIMLIDGKKGWVQKKLVRNI